MATIHDDFFVTVRASEINNNNISKYSPFKCTEINGEPFVPRVKEGICCDVCGKKFGTHSEMFAHKSKPCALPQDAQSEDPIRITFPESELVYVRDFLEKNQITVHKHEDGHTLYIIIDAAQRDYMLRLLFFAQIALFNIEQWYDALQRLANEQGAQSNVYTARTTFMPLTDDDLKLIQKIYMRKRYKMVETADRQEIAALTALEKKIRNAIANHNAERPENERDLFVRLSTRSPKDGLRVVEDTSTQQSLTVEERMKNAFSALKIQTAQQITDLLTNSERVFGDIANFFAHRSLGTASGSINLILRDWCTNLPYQREFRCLVHNGKLTCISQYHCYDVFEELQNKATVERLRDVIIGFHNRIKSVFAYVPSYVLDVVVFPDDSAQVVELNSFGAHMSSGAALFNWETDRELLYNGPPEGQKPYMRVLSKLID